MEHEKEPSIDKGLLGGKLGDAWKSLEKTAGEFLNDKSVRNSYQASEIIARQQQLLEKVMPALEPPFWLGNVVWTDKDKKEVIISCHGKLSSVVLPKSLDLNVLVFLLRKTSI